MSWIITSTGSEHHLTGPATLGWADRPIDTQDIAHHLSMVNQVNGATSRPYSVAEHSLLCCDTAKRAGVSVFVQMAALMHDAHEAYTNAMT